MTRALDVDTGSVHLLQVDPLDVPNTPEQHLQHPHNTRVKQHLQHPYNTCVNNTCNTPTTPPKHLCQTTPQNNTCNTSTTPASNNNTEQHLQHPHSTCIKRHPRTTPHMYQTSLNNTPIKRHPGTTPTAPHDTCSIPEYMHQTTS